jgi:hypothetical protein
MQYSSNHPTNNLDWQPYRWHIYRRLELISDSVPEPHSSAFKFGLGFLWRGLLSLLAAELVDEQRVEYLDRCWARDETELMHQSPTATLQRLWTLME